MDKYKLINAKTKEETLCNKITINGFDYYVSDEKPVKNTKPCYCYNSVKGTLDDDIVFYQGVMPMYHYEGFKIIITTTNPAIDIPKVIDKVDLLYPRLDVRSSKDTMNIYLREGYNKAKETYQYTEQDMIEFADWCINIPKKDKDLLRNNPDITTKELLSIWKEQQIKTIYYGND